MHAYQETIETIQSKLKTNNKTGLSTTQANELLQQYGTNIFTEEKPISIFRIIIQQFLNPLMFILLLAAIASAIIKEYNDAIVISIAMFINVIIGFIQEFKAERAAQALKSYEVPMCQVRRNNKVTQIEAIKLVPGDVVLLPAGSRIPADIRLFYTAEFTVEEAILTGESHAIKKQINQLQENLPLGDRTNMAYAGTYATSGKAEGIVTQTGKNTELGKIATLVVDIKEELTPLQIQIKRFGWFLGLIMLIITSGVLALGLIKGMPFIEIITISIALAVAAIPEGLLVAVTVVLAIGMQRMLKRKALVRHLVAAETLGSVSVICTDKTGTLTKGQMSVTALQCLHENEQPKLLQAMVINNDAQFSPDTKERIGQPTELALLEYAHDKKININSIRTQSQRLTEVPFSSSTKYMATLTRDNNHNLVVVKGALEKIMPMCTLNTNEKTAIENQADGMTEVGLRILAFAQKEITDTTLENNLHNLTYLGLIGLQDPLRENAKQTMNELTGAGIRTVVVTGDHKKTAEIVARGAGIPVRKEGIITGSELEKMSEKELRNNIANIDLFARVEPKHKIRIVDAWQHRGNSVAMIGDGVNDAPALKSADIGVALGSGSDVAHEISDMVLLDNNLATISTAVHEGRVIFDNIRKIIVYLMSDSFSEIVLIVGSLLMGLPMPILATQIFWINLVTDGFPDMALTMEPSEPGLMKEPPRPKNDPVINTEMKTLIFVIGIITDIGLFGLYFGLLHTNFDLPHIRTIMFTALAIDSLFYVFSVRSFRVPIFRMNPFKNKWLNVAVIAGALVQLAAVYIPFMQKLFSTVSLGLMEWGIILGLSLVKVTAIEIMKELFMRQQNLKHRAIPRR